MTPSRAAFIWDDLLPIGERRPAQGRVARDVATDFADSGLFRPMEAGISCGMTGAAEDAPGVHAPILGQARRGLQAQV